MVGVAEVAATHAVAQNIRTHILGFF